MNLDKSVLNTPTHHVGFESVALDVEVVDARGGNPGMSQIGRDTRQRATLLDLLVGLISWASFATMLGVDIGPSASPRATIAGGAAGGP